MAATGEAFVLALVWVWCTEKNMSKKVMNMERRVLLLQGHGAVCSAGSVSVCDCMRLLHDHFVQVERQEIWIDVPKLLVVVVVNVAHHASS